MMEDKRIIRTKRTIKDTLIRMLDQMPFERITVAGICREGYISRVTFYTHYDSKYTLVREMFADYIHEADEGYHRMQQKNNPDNDGRIGYENLMECIADVYFSNRNFFAHTRPEENPYLFSEFYNHVFNTVDDYMKRHKNLLVKYAPRQTAAFICHGLLGLFYICMNDKMSEAEIRTLAMSMFRDILKSELFIH